MRVKFFAAGRNQLLPTRALYTIADRVQQREIMGSNRDFQPPRSGS
jgi:hypothetical protein